jgi:hypothetical protein
VSDSLLGVSSNGVSGVDEEAIANMAGAGPWSIRQANVSTLDRPIALEKIKHVLHKIRRNKTPAVMALVGNSIKPTGQ